MTDFVQKSARISCIASAKQSRTNVETSLIHPSGKIVAACTCDGRLVARREESS
jgi:hypothetical protein